MKFINKSYALGTIFTCLISLSLFFKIESKQYYDVSVVGNLNFADGLARLTIGLLDKFHDKLKMNFVPVNSYYTILQDLPSNIDHYLKNNNEVQNPGNISILFEPIWYPNIGAYRKVPNSFIKIAYSMFETNQLPKQWPAILNNNFDAVIVPDKYYEKIYKKCGVKIPIFTLPIGLYLEEWLSAQPKVVRNDIFTFGLSATFWPHKNYNRLIEAFTKEFGNNNKVKLILHGRGGDQNICNEIKQLIKGYSNISFIDNKLSNHEYKLLMQSFDCYVSLTKGEGYSVTPREAMSLGIPCILSRNTAHKTLCDTGFVRVVTAKIKEPAYYNFLKQYCGYNFNCTLDDASNALKDVYENYSFYLQKAKLAREWVKRYLYDNLEPYYMALLKPTTVKRSHVNLLEPYTLSTNSKKLYKKYKQIINMHHNSRCE